MSAEEFEELRPLLFSIAYRILGSVSEAEDAVQETWLRYHASDDPADLAEVVPVGGGDPGLDRRAAVGPRPPRVVRRPVAARAAADRRRVDGVPRSGARRRARRLAVDGRAAAARAAEPRAARGLRAARRVRVPVQRDRRGGRQVGDRVPAARLARAPADGGRPAAVRRRPPRARGARRAVLRRRDGRRRRRAAGAAGRRRRGVRRRRWQGSAVDAGGRRPGQRRADVRRAGPQVRRLRHSRWSRTR